MCASAHRRVLPHSRHLTSLLLSLLSLIAGQLCAQTITGTMEAIEHPSYAGIASNFLVVDARVDDELIYDGELLIFCSDLDATSLDEEVSSYPHDFTAANSPLVLGSLETLDIWSRYSKTQDEALALAMLHWFVDNHFESSFLNGDDTSQYAFQNVVWEILGDGGTSNGLNFLSGNIDRSKFSPYGRKDAPELWDEMNAMLDSIVAANITTAYQPQNQILAIHDIRPGYQDYIGLARTPAYMQIPEPQVLPLVGIAGILLLTRRRRASLR